MIKGSTVSLRPVAEADLEELHAKLIDIESRGPWYPLPQTSMTKRRKAFEEDGFWSPDEGIFVIVDEQDRLLGTADWNKLNGDVPDMELGYRVFDQANWGKGIATEALDLLAGYLFDTQPINRLRLTIHVDNVGSHRVAEKCGFVNEGRSREAWNHRGKWHDIDAFTLTRAESDQRRKTATVN
jgi:ribosomal-protein-alanine N-acetyltransferase